MKKLFFILSLFCISYAYSQEITGDIEQNPASLRWRQIKTPKFQVIFPLGFEKQAQHTVSTLEFLYEPVSKSLGKTPRRIPILLQNQTTVSNGFVTLLPRRSEFNTIPPQDNALLGTNQWLDLLAVHEFRHVVQYDKALTGWTKAFYYLFGNQGLSLVSNLASPNWFFEGDAVCTETALTNSGRGRIPQFDLAFRTQLLAKGPYTYPKATGRSFKDYVENHYVLGYYMTTYLKRKYGANKWGDVLDKVYKFPFFPFSFSHAIKKTTGLTVEKLYQESLADITQEWKTQLDQVKETPAEAWPTAKNRVFTHYQYPQFLPDGRIIALKSGLADIQTFVLLDKEKGETKLYVPGIVNDVGMLSAGQNQLVWCEHHFDARWGQRDYSVIKMLDVSYKVQRQITTKSRIVAPSFSPDGLKIVAVETSVNNEYSLVIYDIVTGQEIKRFANPQNDFLIQPRFSTDGNSIVFLSLNPKGKTIEVVDLQTDIRKELLPRSNENLGHPVLVGDLVLFNSPVSGIDNIYALDLKTGEQFQITSRKYGAYNPSVSRDGMQLAFNDFTPNGYKVVSMPFDRKLWKPVSEVVSRPIRYFGSLVSQESGGNVLEKVQEKNYTIDHYSRFNLSQLNWGTIANSDNQNLKLGLTLQDLLGTTAITGGYEYDASAQTGKVFANLSYLGWYPVIDFGFDSGQRRTSIYIDRKLPLDSLRTDTWQQNRINFGLRLPFNFTHSKYIQSLNIGASTSIINVTGYDLPVRYYSELFNGSFTAMNYLVSYQSLLKRSQRDVQSRWGLAFYMLARNTPFNGTASSQQFATQASIYLPGLGKHHSLRLRGGYQSQGENDTYRFAGAIFYPRGNNYTSLQNQLTSFSAEYRLPLFNPDLTLGRWLYIQRFKANLFFDYARYSTKNSQNQSVTFQPRSLGFDLSTEFNFMRFSQRLELGFRGLYLPETGSFQIQPLVIDIGF